jgi:sulfur-oxidizing protein SoxX
MKAISLRLKQATPVTLKALALGACTLLLLPGCTEESNGFALPAGDMAQGKATFVALGCNGCHSVADIEHTAIDAEIERLGKPATAKVNVPLGGKTTRYRTQGELVASIINPDHKISLSYDRAAATTDSPMIAVNEAMTVQQLIDLVAFLQDEYDIRTPRTL